MDIADDIAYSTYDLEDSLKAKFVTPLDMISVKSEILQNVAIKVTNALSQQNKSNKVNAEDTLKTLLDIFISQKMFDLKSLRIDIKNIDLNNPLSIAGLVAAVHRASVDIGTVGYLRTKLTSDLVGEFINGVEVDSAARIPALTNVYLKDDVLRKVETLKHFNYEYIIQSSRLKVVQYRGYEIVNTIFEALSAKNGHELLPDDFRMIYDRVKTKREKMRTICDFVAGMTDRYAVEFYGRLKSENAQTIFKPL